MKRTKLIKVAPEQKKPRKATEKVVAKSQIFRFEEENYLNIDLFYMGRLSARYFADGKEYASNINGIWKRMMIENVARVCKNLTPLVGGEYWCCQYNWEWETEEDKKRALSFLGSYSVENYEQSLNDQKYETALERKRKKIIKKMNEVPEAPSGFYKWISEKIFNENYLFVKKKKKMTEFYCTACKGHSRRKADWKHGEKAICPICGEEVIVSSRTQKKIKKVPIVLIQKMENEQEEWTERQFRTVCKWDKEKGKKIAVYEDIRAVMHKKETWGDLYYGQAYDATEFEQYFWSSNQLNKRFLNSFLYPENLKEMLDWMGMEHSGIDIMAKKMVQFNVNKFVINSDVWNWMEYLIKAGMTAAVSDITKNYWDVPRNINISGKNLKECLFLDGNRTARAKKINANLNTIEWLQYEQKMQDKGEKIKINEESLNYINKNNVSLYQTKEILEELGSVNRMVNYLKKQKTRPKKVAEIWKDYLDMAKAEGLDTKDDIIRLPKNLKERHDQLLEIRNAKLDAERIASEKEKYYKLNEKIKDNLKIAKKFFWENPKYMIIPAGKCEELIEEGRKLHHCVGSGTRYMEKMAEGETWILFLRKKEELEKPYYTIEIDVKKNKILQFYSEYDRKPDKEKITKVLNDFRKKIA